MGADRVQRNTTRQVTVAGYAEPLYRKCPHCGARWHRYPAHHLMYTAASRYVDEWPALHFRDVTAAWSGGAARVDVGGQLFQIEPTPPGANAAHPATPLGQPLYVVTAWNPNARPATLTENQRAHAHLEAEVRRAGWHSYPAASLNLGLRWAERAIAITGIRLTQAMRLAQQVSQPILQRWAASRLDLWDSTTGRLAGESVPAQIRRIDRRLCPMRELAGVSQEQEVCRDPGGPWVSASIHESLRWRQQRDVLLDALSCDVCLGAPPRGIGRPIACHPHLVTSRYGPGRPACDSGAAPTAAGDGEE